MSGGYRRTWDKEHYEKKARDRIENGEGDYARGSSESSVKNAAKEEFAPAGEGEIGPMGSQRAFLKARQSKIDLDSKVGKTEIITQTDAVQARGAGFWCEVCSCLLKDSSAYLDHINGKKHQRALGYSMRVERAGVDKVKERLQNIKRKIEETSSKPVVSAIDEHESKVAAQIVEEESKKRKRKEEAEARKREQEEAELETIDPDIAAAMGFGKFG